MRPGPESWKEEILASIRKTLSGDGSDAASAPRNGAPMPAPTWPEPKAPADADGDDLGLLSAKLAGALNGTVNGAALDDDISELLAPENKGPAPSALGRRCGYTKPAEAGGDGKARCGSCSNRPPPRRAAARKRRRTRSSSRGRRSCGPPWPPLFGAEERPTAFRTKTPDSSSVPTAKMQPVPPPPSEAGKTAASSMLTARTQPLMPPAQPADETTKAAPPAPSTRTDAGSGEAVATVPAAREPAPAPEAPLRRSQRRRLHRRRGGAWSSSAPRGKTCQWVAWRRRSRHGRQQSAHPDARAVGGQAGSNHRRRTGPLARAGGR